MLASRQIGSGSSLVIDAPANGDALMLVVGGGRGCMLKLERPLAGIWVPLRGRLQLASANLECALQRGEMRISEAEPGVSAIGRGGALWVAILGSRAAWRRELAAVTTIPVPDPVLLPTSHAADPPFRRRVIALARAAADGSGYAEVQAVIESVCESQSEHAAAIERCPGRTYAQRRQVFLRLQRVRNYLAANCHLDFNNERLARMASYSPWHFIRAFRAAYQQTPHAFLVDQRLQRARGLLRSSPLAVGEIALASGFENRCAFSRLFRRRFGMTAGAMRRCG